MLSGRWVSPSLHVNIIQYNDSSKGDLAFCRSDAQVVRLAAKLRLGNNADIADDQYQYVCEEIYASAKTPVLGAASHRCCLRVNVHLQGALVHI